LIQINIELKKHNRFKELFYSIYNKAEDLAFFIFLKLPENLIPSIFIEWIDRYTTKRINELKQQTVKQTWTKLSLEKAVDPIRQQSTSKAPSED
jgi:hypothetical protein